MPNADRGPTDLAATLRLEGVLDGSLSPDDVPASMRETARLLASARQPAAGTELSGMPATIELFAAAAAGNLATATTGTATTTSTRNVIPMNKKRMPRRAAAAIIGTLLTAGTAAAASGVIGTSDDGFETGDTVLETVADTEAPDDTQAPEDTLAPEDTTAPDDSVAAEGEEADERGPDASGPAGYGLCTAWSNGGLKNESSPARQALERAAEEAGMSLEDYCAGRFDEKDASRGHGDDESEADEGDDEGEEEAPEVEQQRGNQGNGHGNGKNKHD